MPSLFILLLLLASAPVTSKDAVPVVLAALLFSEELVGVRGAAAAATSPVFVSALPAVDDMVIIML